MRRASSAGIEAVLEAAPPILACIDNRPRPAGPQKTICDALYHKGADVMRNVFCRRVSPGALYRSKRLVLLFGLSLVLLGAHGPRISTAATSDRPSVASGDIFPSAPNTLA